MNSAQQLDAMTKYAGAGYAIQAHDARWNAEQLGDVGLTDIRCAQAGLARLHPDGGYPICGDTIARLRSENAA